MKARVGVRVAVLLGLALLVSAPVPPVHAESEGGAKRPQTPLAAKLDAALAVKALRRAHVSAFVVRASDGEVLFEHSPDRALTPASNMKILTALAALQTFGPTHRFETPILADEPLDATGGVHVLFVRGGGDPVLNSEDWWRLAADLHAHGLRRVQGDLVLDDGVFDGARWHPDWGAVSSRAYHAPVGGITANYGAFAVTVKPGARAGDPVKVEVDPPVAYLRVANRARTGPANARSSIVVDRSAAGDVEAGVSGGGSFAYMHMCTNAICVSGWHPPNFFFSLSLSLSLSLPRVGSEWK